MTNSVQELIEHEVDYNGVRTPEDMEQAVAGQVWAHILSTLSDPMEWFYESQPDEDVIVPLMRNALTHPSSVGAFSPLGVDDVKRFQRYHEEDFQRLIDEAVSSQPERMRERAIDRRIDEWKEAG